ncbi:hypothetical protein [Roseateles saccharophilus]|uniref:Uncharacterized protein n=1 Tax=Roseateles saccharophilus TaxID=304 RepID=A0A4R3VEI8_ROSSA|nr:hypothetical protein [Roseateles saccharophilus]MDG0832262.1 hypothetical protein [Roseateles saccharophilus]TCV02363.1 hypothetical protein EV671_1004136 [Roseateles saccharophilus]
MADSKGGVLGSFPWASLAVLMAFVASTQLVPHAFDALRPAEKARAQAPLDPDLEINARLWEDPFAALRRYELERSERCERQQKASRPVDGDCSRQMPRLRDPRNLLARLDADQNQRMDDILVILALMPGADFVGAEEARRRIRYATLAGLLAQDYVPDNAERLSLLEFRLLDAQAEAGGPGYMVPYELLSLRRPATEQPPSRYAQVALLWVDETALPLRKLDAVARLTEQLMGREARERAHLRFRFDAQDVLPRLAVIGPSSTDALRTALRDLRCAADLNNTAGIGTSQLAESDAVRCARRGEDVRAGLPADVLAGYRLLARAEFYNPSSTAPERMLPELQGYTRAVTGLDDGLDAFLTQHFSRLTGAQGRPPPVHMLRTVGSDADLIDKLVAELKLRLPQRHRRVVIVAERDSIYAQALVEQFRDDLPADLQKSLRVIYFFRGIDGVTTKDANAAAALATAADKTPPLEWPESRDQLDYLRRLGMELQRSESGNGDMPIGAIGIFANDVHDKLLVLQALHENFSDRMFFTTDMDARYLHPRTQAFTRNLIVASSLPLAFYPVPPEKAGSALDLQAGTPPLRDIYQTSTYAAARRAGCRSDPCKQREGRALDEVLKHTSVYEIGRSGTVPLSGYALERRPPQSSMGRVFVALLMAAVFGCMLFAWPSTPSMRQARRVLLPRSPGEAAMRMEPTAIILVTMHAVLLSYGMFSLVEFVLPGRMSFGRAPLLAALAAGAALLVGLTGCKSGGQRRPTALLTAGLALLVTTWLALAWPAGGWRPGGICPTCEPTVWLEGVSAWPSHLIHLLALFTLLWTLDWAWADSQEQLCRDSDWLHLPRPPEHPSVTALLRNWFSTVSVLFWKPGVGYSCDFKQLWIEYGERGEASPRSARTLFWFTLTLGVVTLLFLGLNDGQIPEVPARGREYRGLVRVTLYAALLLLPLLIVAVADATVLLTRFVRHLNVGRSFYPDETIELFAKALGSEHQDLWAQRFSARPEERVQGRGGFAMHTLLDDWIDVQVVARRSVPVARLVIGPFVVLALLVVARSRLFDNWSLTPAIAVGVSFYVATLIGLTFLLKQAAENARSRALESMQADLRWLAGCGAPLAGLQEPFKRLIAQVENEQKGAFASFFDQPLLKALLVPLGGAGGTQLFDYLLLGR